MPTHSRSNARLAALRVMAKMAQVDGHIHRRERDFLMEMLPQDAREEELQELLDSVETADLAGLTQHVDRYEDRFLIAYRAFTMAHVDKHYDKAERRTFDRLIQLLEILPEDRRLIESTQQPEAAVATPNERLRELFSKSSFAPPVG